MASSNRHWPSLFKSKPCNSLHQWQHDLNPSLLSGYHHRNPYTSGIEEKGPEPKPRWNPKPEQIRILEAIFNSGMVNPPRDEIRKIRAQLQEYGQVGDANVFYWFQNRKSRTKHKNRQLAKSQHNKSTETVISSTTTITNNNAHPSMITNPSSSSSSSDKSSPKLIFKKTSCNNHNDFYLGAGSSNFLNQLAYSPTASVNQTTYDDHDVQHENFMFPSIQQQNYSTQGFSGFLDHHHLHSHSQPQQMMNMTMMRTNNMNNNNNVTDADPGVGPCSELLFCELIRNAHGESDLQNGAEDEENLMMMKLGYPSASSPISTTTTLPLPSNLDQLQGSDASCVSAIIGPMKSTVFINDVAFEVHCEPFNVRESFGNDAVLLHSTGQLVLTNEWGVTLQPLQHGAFYYLI